MIEPNKARSASKLERLLDSEMLLVGMFKVRLSVLLEIKRHLHGDTGRKITGAVIVVISSTLRAKFQPMKITAHRGLHRVANRAGWPIVSPGHRLLLSVQGMHQCGYQDPHNESAKRAEHKPKQSVGEFAIDEGQEASASLAVLDPLH